MYRKKAYGFLRMYRKKVYGFWTEMVFQVWKGYAIPTKNNWTCFIACLHAMADAPHTPQSKKTKSGFNSPLREDGNIFEYLCQFHLKKHCTHALSKLILLGGTFFWGRISFFLWNAMLMNIDDIFWIFQLAGLISILFDDITSNPLNWKIGILDDFRPGCVALERGDQQHKQLLICFVFWYVPFISISPVVLFEGQQHSHQRFSVSKQSSFALSLSKRRARRPRALYGHWPANAHLCSVEGSDSAVLG